MSHTDQSVPVVTHCRGVQIADGFPTKTFFIHLEATDQTIIAITNANTYPIRDLLKTLPTAFVENDVKAEKVVDTGILKRVNNIRINGKDTCSGERCRC